MSLTRIVGDAVPARLVVERRSRAEARGVTGGARTASAGAAPPRGVPGASSTSSTPMCRAVPPARRSSLSGDGGTAPLSRAVRAAAGVAKPGPVSRRREREGDGDAAPLPSPALSAATVPRAARTMWPDDRGGTTCLGRVSTGGASCRFMRRRSNTSGRNFELDAAPGRSRGSEHRAGPPRRMRDPRCPPAGVHVRRVAERGARTLCGSGRGRGRTASRVEAGVERDCCGLEGRSDRVERGADDGASSTGRMLSRSLRS
jgi:hypothetical protein